MIDSYLPQNYCADVRARDDGKKAQNMERMLGSIREGQSISEFKTMQSLIKQEAVAAKVFNFYV